MNEQILLITILLRKKCSLEELFNYLNKKLEEENPWRDINNLRLALAELWEKEFITGGLNLSVPIEITMKGKKFLRTNKIVDLLEEALSGPTLWK